MAHLFSHVFVLENKITMWWESLKQRSHLVKFLWQNEYVKGWPITCERMLNDLHPMANFNICWLIEFHSENTHPERSVSFPKACQRKLGWRRQPAGMAGKSTVCDEMSRPHSYSVRPTFLWLVFLKKYAIVFCTHFALFGVTRFDPVTTRRVLRLRIDQSACKYGR